MAYSCRGVCSDKAVGPPRGMLPCVSELTPLAWNLPALAQGWLPGKRCGFPLWVRLISVADLPALSNGQPARPPSSLLLNLISVSRASEHSRRNWDILLHPFEGKSRVCRRLYGVYFHISRGRVNTYIFCMTSSVTGRISVHFYCLSGELFASLAFKSMFSCGNRRCKSENMSHSFLKMGPKNVF